MGEHDFNIFELDQAALLNPWIIFHLHQSWYAHALAGCIAQPIDHLPSASILVCRCSNKLHCSTQHSSFGIHLTNLKWVPLISHFQSSLNLDLWSECLIFDSCSLISEW